MILMMWLGIDPGRFKIGLALADCDKLLFSAIVPKDEQEILFTAVKNSNWGLLEIWKKEGSSSCVIDKTPQRILIGNGTSSKEIKNSLATLEHVETVDEYGTTLAGRSLYWKLHPPKGLMRIIPTSLRTPPRDIDDLAAWAIIINSVHSKQR